MLFAMRWNNNKKLPLLSLFFLLGFSSGIFLLVWVKKYLKYKNVVAKKQCFVNFWGSLKAKLTKIRSNYSWALLTSSQKSKECSLKTEIALTLLKVINPEYLPYFLIFLKIFLFYCFLLRHIYSHKCF